MMWAVKEKQIVDFIKCNADECIQHSEKWRQLIRTTIGGSEMATVMGIKSGCTREQLIQKKKHPELFPDEHPVPCMWGTMFEPLIRRYTEISLNTRVHGSNICIRKMPGQRTSPDGYCVVNYGVDAAGNIVVSNIWSDLRTVIGTLIVLLEFKCPFISMPDGKVPDKYLPQVHSGIAVSDIADCGIFINSVFRKCALNDILDSSRYDIEYHDSYYRKRSGKPGDKKAHVSDLCKAAISFGIIGVYSENKLAAGIESVYDFGSAPKELFDNMMLRTQTGDLVIRYSDVLMVGSGFDDVYTEIVGLESYDTRTRKLIGIIPWKLFYVDTIPVPPKPDFIKDMKKYITEFWADAAHCL